MKRDFRRCLLFRIPLRLAVWMTTVFLYPFVSETTTIAWAAEANSDVSSVDADGKRILQEVEQLAELADKTKDRDETRRLYDQIIAVTENRSETRLVQFGCWARWRKVLSVDPSEKEKLCDELIGKYGDSSSPYIQSFVLMAKRTKAANLDAAERLEVLAGFVEEYKNVQYKKTKQGVIRTINDMLKILEKETGQDQWYERLADSLIGSRHESEIPRVRMPWVLAASDADEGLERMARLTGDQDYRFDEAQHAEFAKTGRKLAESLADIEMKKKVYDWLLTRYENRFGNNLDREIYAIFHQRIKMAATPEEELSYLDRFLTRARGGGNAAPLSQIAQALERKTILTGDKSTALKYYDDIIEKSGFEELVVGAMLRKSHLHHDYSAKNRVYDQMLERFGDSENFHVLDNLLDILDFKSKQGDDRDLLLSAYAKIVEKTKEPSSDREIHVAIKALAGLMRLTEDESERLGICDRIIAMGRGSKRGKSEKLIGEAVRQKSQILQDETIIDSYYNNRLDATRSDRDKVAVLVDRVRGEMDRQKKKKLYDEIIGYRNSRDKRVRDQGESTIYSV